MTDKEAARLIYIWLAGQNPEVPFPAPILPPDAIDKLEYLMNALLTTETLEWLPAWVADYQKGHPTDETVDYGGETLSLRAIREDTWINDRGANG